MESPDDTATPMAGGRRGDWYRWFSVNFVCGLIWSVPDLVSWYVWQHEVPHSSAYNVMSMVFLGMAFVVVIPLAMLWAIGRSFGRRLGTRSLLPLRLGGAAVFHFGVLVSYLAVLGGSAL